MIKVEELCKVFRTEEIETTALDNVSLRIREGEFVAIMGPSGCGKSTLLNILGLLDNPTSGSYGFLGQEVGSLKEKDRTRFRKGNIGFVFQSFNLIDELDVFENVELPLRYLNIPAKERKERVTEILKRMNIYHRAKHFPQQLSGGQQQRVALARALVIRPKVLLLDECLSALDKKLRVEMQIELRKILEESKVTTFFVTHDQEEAMTLSDQIVVMHDGIIEQTGSPMEVYEKPRNKFVADFLGKANFFDGTLVKSEQNVLTLKLEDGNMLEIPGVCDAGNEEVHFAVRPEKITVSAEKAEGTALEGTIDSLTYSGNIMSCIVDCGAFSMKAEMSGAGAALRLKRGDQVYLTWDAASTVRLEG